MSIRDVRFYKLSPGGNTTILVMDAESIAASERAPMAARLMDPLHLHAEQVGYVSGVADCGGNGVPLARLDMMGGEFCGNASRCLAAVMALEGVLEAEGTISVSGAPAPLAVRTVHGEDAVDAWVGMPVRPDAGCVRRLAAGISMVTLDGITHLLLDEAVHPFPGDVVAEAARLRQRHGLDSEDAVGCIWHRETDGGPAILPVVWVRATDTTHVETACGSGTMALAQATALETGGSVVVDVLQPSGERIAAKITWDAECALFSDAWIGGPVALIATGTARV